MTAIGVTEPESSKYGYSAIGYLKGRTYTAKRSDSEVVSINQFALIENAFQAESLFELPSPDYGPVQQFATAAYRQSDDSLKDIMYAVGVIASGNSNKFYVVAMGQGPVKLCPDDINPGQEDAVLFLFKTARSNDLLIDITLAVQIDDSLVVSSKIYDSEMSSREGRARTG